MPSFRPSRRPRLDLPGPTDLGTQIALGRTVVAAGIMVAPTTFVRTLGADRATAKRVIWLTRMMAVRDAAIGVGAIAAGRRGDDLAPWLLAGAVSDGVDALVLASALRHGRVHGLVAVATAPAAAVVAVVGAVVALRRSR